MTGIVSGNAAEHIQEVIEWIRILSLQKEI